MNLQNSTEKMYSFIDHHQLIPHNSTIVIGFSGGPDSMFLLHLLAHMRHEKNLTLVAAHLDHQWRPESASEVKFCAQAAEHVSVRFMSGTAAELSSTVKFDGSQEELGRMLRRQFLERVADEVGANRIALAHHAQDQEETFFIRLIRGTTLSGLIGMKPHSGKYIRPLLETNKDDLVRYLNEHAIAYLTDPSNELLTFLRNRIRMNVLPALRACDKRFDANFARTLKSLQETEAYLDTVTRELFLEITKEENRIFILDLKRLFSFPPYLQHRIILYWLIQEHVPFEPQESFLIEILKFLKSEHGGSHHLHFTWKIEKKKNFACIKKSQ